MKKVLSTLLVLTMVVSLISGCAKTEPSAEETSEKIEESAEKTEAAEKTEESAEAADTVAVEEIPEEEWLPLVKEGEDNKLSIGVPQSANVEDYETNALTKYVEESTGVELEFVYFSNVQSEFEQQLALMISGGEKLPDVFWGFVNMPTSLLFEYGRDGYFLDLNGYLDENGHYFKQQMAQLTEEEQDLIWQLGTDPESGGFYGLPRQGFAAYDSGHPLMAINKVWLEALDLEAPATIEDLYNVLVAFRDQDPNGNGTADEIPFLGFEGGANADISTYIINAFVYYNKTYPVNVTDGKIWAPFAADEYREGMKWINKMVSENLLSPLTFSFAARAEFTTVLCPADQKGIVGVMAGTTSVWEADNSVILEYTGLAPLNDETGKGGYMVLDSAVPIYPSFVSADCENIELAVRFLDFFYQDDCVRRTRFGEEGVDWIRVEGATTMYGQETCMEVVNADAFSKGNATWQRNGNQITRPMNYTKAGDILADTSFTGDVYRLYASQGEAMNTKSMPDELITKLPFNSEENEVIAEIETVLKDYLKQARAEFATGVMDPNNDADWQKYLNNLETMGLTEWLAAYQSAYDRTKAE